MGTFKENRESLLNRLKGHWPKKHVMLADLAYTLAKYAHRHGKRKGELDPETGKPVRYLIHPVRVTIIIVDEAGVRDLETVLAAILHDTVEDGRNAVTLDNLEHIFGNILSRTVGFLSKKPKKGGKSDDRRYLGILMTEADWRALLVKLADRLDNIRSLTGMDEAFIRKQIKETREKYLPLFERLVAITPKKYADGVRRLRDELISLVHEYEKKYPPRD